MPECSVKLFFLVLDLSFSTLQLLILDNSHSPNVMTSLVDSVVRAARHERDGIVSAKSLIICVMSNFKFHCLMWKFTIL